MNNKHNQSNILHYLSIVVLAVAGAFLIWGSYQLSTANRAVSGPIAPTTAIEVAASTATQSIPPTELPVTIAYLEPTKYASPLPWTLTATAGAQDGIVYDFVNQFRIIV